MTEYTGTQRCVCKIMELAWLRQDPGKTHLVPGDWGGAGTLDNVRLGGVQEEERLPVFGGPGINKASLTRQPFSLCCRLPFMGYCHPFPVGNAR